MPVDAGSVVVGLGGKFDDTAFRRFDDAMEKARREKDLKAELGGDFNPGAFKRYEAELDKVQRRTRDRDAFKAKLGADYNPAAFRAYQRDLDRADRGTSVFGGTTDRTTKSHGRLIGILGTAGLGMRAAGGGALVAAAAVGLLGKAAVTTATSINESLTKNQQLFGKFAAGVDRWSRQTAKGLGISREAALESAGSFGSLFETIKLQDEPAANMSKRLVTLASDLASFNNASPEEALEALRSGLIGEAEPMRRFGALLSEARVKTEAYRSGIAEQGAELTEAQKVQARYNLILKDTKSSQGDFAKTSGGLANQIRILRARVSDLGASIGARLMPVVLTVTKFLNRLFGDTDKGGRRVDQLKAKLTSMGVPIKQIGVEVQKLWASVRRSFKGIEGDLRAIGTGLAAIGGWLLAVFRRALPGIRKTLTGLADMIRGIVQIIAGILTLDFGRAWDGVKNIFGGAIEAILGLLRVFSAATRELAARIANALRKPILAAIDFILGGFTTLLDLASKLTGAFGWVPGVGGNMKRAARDIDDARDSIDGFRESLREQDAQMHRSRAMREARDDVDALHQRLKGLRKGTEEYHDTAEKLRRKQRQLNDAVSAARPAARTAGRGARGLAGNFGQLGEVFGDVTSYVSDQTNTILSDFGAKTLRHKIKTFPKLKPFGQEFRGGGLAGGLVPAMVSPGELLVDPGGTASKVPGARTAADSVLAFLRYGTAVLTGHGQQLLASGSSLPDAVNRQLPHFAAGGVAAGATTNNIVFAFQPGGWAGGSPHTSPGFGGITAPAVGGHGLTAHGRKLRGKWGKVVTHIEDRIEGLGHTYDLKSRRFDFTEEEFVNEGDENTPPSLNQTAIGRRAHELEVLIGVRQKMVAQYQRLVTYLERLNRLWRTLQRRLEGSIGRAQDRLKHLGKGKEASRTRKAIEGRIGKWRDRLSTVRDDLSQGVQAREDAGFELRSTRLDVQELRNELAPLLGGGKGIELPEWTAPDTGGDDTGTDESAPTPEQIASAAREQLRSFSANRAELFGSFGQNFARSGTNPFATDTGQAAGMRFFGAASGNGGGVVAAGGGKVINIENFAIDQTFPERADPDTWSRGIAYELRAGGVL